MTPDTSTHLTDEALDDVLIGLGSLQSEAHLARCPQCRCRVESFRADMTLFNSASMAWSESRTGRSAQVSPHHAGFRIRFAFVSWSAVAALLLVTAMAIWRHSAVAPPNHVNIVEPQPVDSEAQIAQDNQLLEEINAAISSDDESPVEEYNLREHPHARMKPHSQ
jgi:anti-sigma factor RsiW